VTILKPIVLAAILFAAPAASHSSAPFSSRESMKLEHMIDSADYDALLKRLTKQDQ